MSYPTAAPCAEPAVSNRRTVPAIGISVYGCDHDEAELFRQLAPRFGTTLTVTDEPVTESSARLAFGNRCISVSHKNELTGSALRALRLAGVEYISTRSIGFNHINTQAAEQLGITVANVNYSPDAVADYTIMLILMAIRQAKSTVLATQTHDYRSPTIRGKELRDLTVGVIGAGRIGNCVMRRLQGFGCRILCYDPYPNGAADAVRLDCVLRESDIITIHAPLTADTYHLLDRKLIAQMKDGSYLINTGRGPIVDTEALLSALTTGKLAGAALDVLEGEEGIFYSDCRPGDIEHTWAAKLQALPNVIISPHSAYFTDHALRDTVENSLRNCLDFESGKIA